MNATMGLYRAGTSVLHRLPAGVKLAGLVVAGALSILVKAPLQTALALTGVLCMYAAARIPLRIVLDMLRPLSWLVIPLGAFHVVVGGCARGFVVVGVIVALVLFANLVTLTTRTAELVDVVVRLCRPLRRLGVHPEKVGLMLQVAIRAVPLTIALAGQVRDAQRARGLTASPSAFAVPLIVGALRRADALADALAARGFDD